MNHQTFRHALAAVFGVWAMGDVLAQSAPSAPASAASASASAPVASLQRVEITAKAHHLNDARTGIQTQTGASVYTVTADAIAAMPGGDNSLLNQVLLQTPDVSQDSFGQFHVRGEHNGLQYRLDGVILPEGMNVFGQSLDPRLIESVSLVTGALPAEYGLRTAGIVDVKTRSGTIDSGATLSMYGGSHGTVQPSFNWAGTVGDLHYYVSADQLRNDVGIESPDGRPRPLHDRTVQTHAFAYVEDILDAENRVGAAFGSSDGSFQIPNVAGSQPAAGWTVNGQTQYPSAMLDERQQESTQFAFVSLQHAGGALDWQASLVGRGSGLDFTPDLTGDLLYNGIAQAASKRNQALALQFDVAYRWHDQHTLRAGVFLQHDSTTNRTNSWVLPVNGQGVQTSDVPISIADNSSRSESLASLYLQDEWRWLPELTLNGGVRFDRYRAFTSAQQVSPRVNLVWKAAKDTTLHLGYASYFSPPPFELVGTQTLSQFAGTSAQPEVGLDDSPRPERARYLDIGFDQQLGQGLSAGVDAYYKRSSHLLDEGQFGAPIILTPFNYARGLQFGEEFKINYAGPRFSAYANLALQRAVGRQIESAQFNFSAADLAYIAQHDIDLDHEQRVTASAGASWLWQRTRLSADLVIGSGLRAVRVLADGSTVPNGSHLPSYTQLNLGASRKFNLDALGSWTLRLDVINALDRVYEIRNGTGVGVGAPQFGPRRGLFAGASAEF